MTRSLKESFVAYAVSSVDWATLERLHIVCGTTADGRLVMTHAEWDRALKARAIVLAANGLRSPRQDRP